MKEELIDKKKLKIFLRFSENEDMFGVVEVLEEKLSENEFRILSDLNEILKDYHNKYSSKEFKIRIKEKLDVLRSFVTDEVFQMLEKDKI